MTDLNKALAAFADEYLPSGVRETPEWQAVLAAVIPTEAVERLFWATEALLDEYPGADTYTDEAGAALEDIDKVTGWRAKHEVLVTAAIEKALATVGSRPDDL